MSRLPAGWDGSDGLPISATAVAMAFELMVSAAARSGNSTAMVVPWTSAPFADGGLQVEWKGPGGEIEVQISPVGNLGYLLQVGADDDGEFEESDHATTEQVVDLIQRVVASLNEPR